jgi:hypothetical protein
MSNKSISQHDSVLRIPRSPQPYEKPVSDDVAMNRINIGLGSWTLATVLGFL